MSGEKPDDGNGEDQDGVNADASNGTPDTTGRNAEQDANIAALAKAQQETIAKERARSRELEAENERLRRAQSPAAPRPTGDPRADKIAAAKAWAEGRGTPRTDGKDDVAGLVLDVIDELHMTQAEIANLRQLDRIRDDDERKEAEDLFNNNRNLYGTPAVALSVLREQKLAARVKAQEEENEKLKAALAANSRVTNGDVVRTLTRDVSATELKSRELTRAEWTERQAALEAAEDAGDAKAGKLRRAEQMKLRSGDLKVRG